MSQKNFLPRLTFPRKRIFPRSSLGSHDHQTRHLAQEKLQKSTISYFPAKIHIQVKSRIQKGLPDALRPEAWKKLCKIKDRDIEVYKQLYNQDSPMAEQIDLDINRSYRNHVIFRERFGKG